MSLSAPPLILASASPRRASLLRMLGLAFDQMSAGVDETVIPRESPAAHAERLARAKAMSVAARRPEALVLGCDTIVVIDQDILGKPVDTADAVAMLLQLAGRFHTVVSAVALAGPGGRTLSAVESTHVRFRAFDAEEAARYVATGEPMDKAGAYGIQGFGAALVAEIRGDYYTVVGLPILRMLELLEAMGWRYAFGRLVRVDR
ncbi:MAG: septum formation inhibitor Maf [Gemmatimonadetes bacterium]|nr:septum formation inhibitor Maf [Gemmatimonadota bacterium]